MTPLQVFIGTESELHVVGSALRRFAEELGAPAVGAYHVTCSDELERECEEAFQRWFAQAALPDLKPHRPAPFRSVNLGARYEWGAIRVAEEHYATPASRKTFKLLVVKINSHVAVRPTPEGPKYGLLDRYGCESAGCGALTGLFEGSSLPAVVELRRLFRSGDEDRMAALADPNVVDPHCRALLAAVTCARLQAHRAVLDIQEYQPVTPTVYLVLPCVTLNRTGADTELVVGQYGIDHTEDIAKVKYRGLGDDPADYRVNHDDRDRLSIEDEQWSGTASEG